MAPVDGCQAGAMRMLRALVLVAAVAATAVVGPPVTAVAAGAATVKYPNLVGTWTGTYRFPSGTDTAIDSHETLVIDKQDRELLWGHDQYIDKGQAVRIPLRGSIGIDRKSFGLAETSGLFLGRIVSKKVVEIRFFRTDDKYTSFAARLKRTPT
jgi:hypothetical protein